LHGDYLGKDSLELGGRKLILRSRYGSSCAIFVCMNEEWTWFELVGSYIDVYTTLREKSISQRKVSAVPIPNEMDHKPWFLMQ